MENDRDRRFYKVGRASPPVSRPGDKTDASLHVLADGSVTLTIGDRCSAVLDDPSASFGNTGLLADHTWPYGATAGPHGAGREKGAKIPTSKAHISVVFHSFRLIFGRAIISRNGLEA